MYDYRRNQKRDERDSALGNAKNLASIAIVGTAGYHYLKKVNQDVKTVEQANLDLLRRGRQNLENLSPLLTDNLIERMEKSAQPTRVQEITLGVGSESPIYEYDPFQVDEPENIPEEMLEEFKDEVKADSDISFRTLLNEEEITSENIERIAWSQANFSNAAEKMERKYPGFLAAIQREELGMTVLHIKESKGYAKTFDLLVEGSGGKKVSISLPNYTNGYIREGFREWIHRPGAVLSSDGTKVLAPRFDRSFLSRLVPKLDNLLKDVDKLKSDPALVLKKYVGDTLGYLFQKEGVTVTTNSALGLGGFSFIATQPKEYLDEAAFNQKKRNEALKWWSSFEGKPLYLQTGQLDSQKMIDDKEMANLVNTGKVVSMTGVSETAFTKSGAMSTMPELGIGPGYDFHKQSTFRQNALKGWGVTKSREKWAAQLGMVSEGYLNEIAGNFTEDYTGRMSHIGFYFGEEKNIFDGAAVYINQHVDGKPMSMDFVGRSTESINLKLLVKGGQNDKMVSITGDLYSRFKNGGEITVYKGQVLGFDPANNKQIRAPRSGVITHMHADHETGELKIQLSSDKRLNKGDKILQTKEVIEHMVDPKSIHGFYLGGEDQEVAEYISRGRGKTGIEFLLNGGTMKRFMNGGVGMGFVNKVLSDVLEMKKEEFHKLGDDTIAKADFKERMKLFAEDFINYQLGPDAKGAIGAIHIDDDMNIGLELKESYRPGSDVFHKTLDLETLIKSGESSGIWSPFIKRMEDVEKFINTNKHLGGNIQYSVIRYAKNINDRMHTDPRHLSAFIMGGSDKAPGRMIQANLRMLLGTHAVSDINVAKTAGLRWNSRGFIGGTKISAEMRRNFVSMGFHGLAAYTDHLMDYRMNYILDKTKVKDMFVLNSREIAMHENTVTIGNRKLDVKTVNFLLDKPDDILGRLQQETLIGDELKIFHSVQMARNSLHNIQGLDQGIVDKLMKNELLSIEDLTALGKQGIGGNSVGLITKDFMNHLVNEINNSDPKSKGKYLKLPFEINFGDNVKGDLVSLINFDKEETFEIASAKFMDPDGEIAGAKLKRQCYTLGGMQAEYIDYMKKVAQATRDWHDARGDEKKRQAIVMQTQNDTTALWRSIRSLTEGKSSGYTQAVHNGAAPLSARGEVKGAIGLKLGEMGITSDRLTALLTGDQTTSFKDLEGMVKAVEKLKSIKDFPELMHIIASDKKGKFNIKAARRSLSEYRKSLRMAAGNLPEGELIMDQITGLFETMNKGLDELGMKGGKDKTAEVFKRLRKEIPNSADAILKILEDEHINNSNALAVLEAARSGKTDLFVTGERFPIKGPGAQSFWKLKIHEPEGVNARDYIDNEIKKAKLAGVSGKGLEHVRKTAVDNAKRVHSYLYLNQSDMLGISGDFDKDFVNIILTSIDTVQNIHVTNMRAFGKTQAQINDFMDKNVRAKLFNPPSRSDMSRDTLRGYIERLTVVTPDNDRTFKPANAQSSIIVDVVNNAKYLQSQSPISTISLKEGIEKTVEESCSHLDPAARKQMVDSLLLEAHTKIKTYYPGADFGRMKDSLKFVTDLRYIDVKHTTESATDAHMKIIDPEIRGLTTEDELKAHMESSTNSKEAHNRFTRRVEEQYVNRFGEMKIDTPTAYKLGANINRLAENAAMGEAEKDFMYSLADKITQTTISIKHGTPSYLDFYRRTILKLESSKHADANTITRLVNANPELDMPGFKREMKGFGFLKTMDDVMDFDTFEKYLEEKERIGSILKDAHEKAGQQKIDMIKKGVRDTEAIRKQYRATIDGHMTNHSVNGIHNQVAMSEVLKENDWMYSPETTNRYILMAADERKNAAAARNSLRGYTEEQWKFLASRLKQSKDETGLSILADPYEHIRTKMKSEFGSEGAAFHIENMFSTLRYADTIDAHSSQQSLMRVMAANYRMSAKASLGNPEKDIKTLRKLQMSENANIKREVFQKGSKPTIFYSGSILEGLAGKTHAPASPTPEGIRAANAGGSAKLKALGIGFLVGAFVGQAINILTEGNAISGMGNSPGVGGEYYENAGLLGKNITGREMEFFSREKPVKLTSGWSYWNNEMKYQQGVQNIKDSEIRRDNPRYKSSFKGGNGRMKIKIYTNSTEKASELMNKVYEIVKEATGKEPNIRITNQSRLK